MHKIILFSWNKKWHNIWPRGCHTYCRKIANIVPERSSNFQGQYFCFIISLTPIHTWLIWSVYLSQAHMILNIPNVSKWIIHSTIINTLWSQKRDRKFLIFHLTASPARKTFDVIYASVVVNLYLNSSTWNPNYDMEYFQTNPGIEYLYFLKRITMNISF